MKSTLIAAGFAIFAHGAFAIRIPPRGMKDQSAPTYLLPSSQSPSSEVGPAGNSYTQLCPHKEGDIRTINGRQYRIYCHNSRWKGYSIKKKSATFADCERQYHAESRPTFGFHWYPSTEQCNVYTDRDAKLYVYRHGTNEKIFAIPISHTKDYPLCPLIHGEGEVWRISGKLYRLFCRGQAKVDKKNLVQLKGLTTDIAECEEFSRQQGGELFHWYQPSQDAPGSAGYTGKRACEVVKSWPNPRELVPLRTMNTYLAVIPFSGPGDIIVHGEINSEALDEVREEALEEVLEEAYEEAHEEV